MEEQEIFVEGMTSCVKEKRLQIGSQPWRPKDNSTAYRTEISNARLSLERLKLWMVAQFTMHCKSMIVSSTISLRSPS
jgi:hypothetical protein